MTKSILHLLELIFNEDEGERAPLYQPPPAKKEAEMHPEEKEEPLKPEKKKKKPLTEVRCLLNFI